MFLKNILTHQSKPSSIARLPARNFSGGGKKKPDMPAAETQFDVVVVGNF